MYSISRSGYILPVVIANLADNFYYYCMNRTLLVLLVIGLIGFYLHEPQKKVYTGIQQIQELGLTYDSKLSIDQPPIQKNIKKTVAISAGDFTITPLAEFQVAARVLSAKHYTFDQEAKLSPVDLALGWGPMAKDDVLKDISISQNGRFYHWRLQEFPIPRKDIETNSANMHFIPATPDIEKKLKEIDEGDRIKFKGYLVRVDRADGWRWVSSTTRNDTGGGACEVILVDDITLL